MMICKHDEHKKNKISCSTALPLGNIQTNAVGLTGSDRNRSLTYLVTITNHFLTCDSLSQPRWRATTTVLRPAVVAAAGPVAGAVAEAQQPQGGKAARHGLVLFRVRGNDGADLVLVDVVVLACLRGHRGEEPPAGGRRHLDWRRRALSSPPLPEAEPP